MKVAEQALTFARNARTRNEVISLLQGLVHELRTIWHQVKQYDLGKLGEFISPNYRMST